MSIEEIRRRNRALMTAGDTIALHCTACAEQASVHHSLGRAPGGDVPIWECRNCGAQWHEDGTPR